MKIQVIETGMYLYFPPGTKISLQLTSQLLNEIGSFSMPLSIPLKENSKAFNFPDKLSITNVRRRVPAYLFLLNNQIPVDLLLLNVSNTIKLSLLFADSLSNYLNKNILLKDMDIDVLNIGDIGDMTTYFNTNNNKRYPETPFACFPIAPNSTTPGLYSSYEINKWAHIDMGLPEPHLKYGYYNLFTINPFVYVSYILQKISDHCGKNISINQFQADAELNTLVFINLNRGVILLSPEGALLDFARVLPQITASDLLKRLWSTFGLKLVSSIFDTNAKFVLIKNVLQSFYREDLTQYLLVKPDSNVDYSSINDGVQFTPDFSINCDYYKTQIKDISNKFILGSYQYYSSLPSASWSNLGYLAYVAENDNYYESTNSGWIFYSRNIQTHKVGDGTENNANQIAGILSATWTGYSPDYDYFMPKCLLEVNNPEQSVILAFYRGMHEEPSLEVDFPYGSADIYKTADGVVFPDVNYALKNAGANGLIAKFWSEYVRMKSISIDIVLNFNLTLRKVMNLDLSQIYRVNQIDYLISEMQFELDVDTDRISEVQGKLKKVR